jgi:kumamolisin
VSAQSTIAFAPSHHTLRPNSLREGAAVAEQRIEVSVYLKRKDENLADLGESQMARRGALHHHRAAAYGHEVELIRGFAAAHGLSVTAVEPARRLVKLAGSVAELEAAFGVTLHIYAGPSGQYRSYEGSLQLPPEVVDSVEAVLGLDNHPAAAPNFVQAQGAGMQSYVATALWPNQIGACYGFPANLSAGSECIGIIELGGAYQESDTAAAFTAMGLTVPTVVAVAVDGAQPASNPNADGEVALDIQVAGANAPGATIAVYFAPNTYQGFADAISHAATDTANSPSVISISWGSSESDWGIGTPGGPMPQAVQALNSAMQDAAELNVSVFVASGDHLGTNSETDGRAHVQFPASSPWAIGCGGTLIDTTGTVINSEVVWNDGASGWGTGGGISDFFPVPSFQQNIGLPVSVNDGQLRRGVPDIAGNAAPSSGYIVVLNGTNASFGGTSAVAPLWAGLTAVINGNAPQKIGFFLPLLYQNPGDLLDIVQGNNKPAGSNLGYEAGPGWDACTGLGSPNGAALLQLFAPGT